MGASWTGLAGLLLTGGGHAASAPAAMTMIGIALTILGSFVMLFTRHAGEYTQRLWNAGASVAFGALLMLTAGLGFVEGLIEGFTDTERERSVSADAALLLDIAAFYIGLFAKRLLGDR